MRTLSLLISLLLSGTSLAVLAAGPASEPTRVDNVRPLLVSAIDSPSGEAHGVLIGPMAEAINRRFQTTAPIRIDVTTIKRFSEAGCSRLKVLFSQDGVLLPKTSAPERRTIEFGINYCRDGLPPRQAS